MYTRAKDINFFGIEGMDRRFDADYYDYFDQIVHVFEYKNVIFSVTRPEEEPEIIEITVHCTPKEQYFSTAMKNLADVEKYERINAKDFNMNEFIKALDILDNISKTF